MDWQIRIALIIAGILLIGYIYYDFNRRNKRELKNQKLIKDLRVSAEAIDSEGFDINGVSSARSASTALNEQEETIAQQMEFDTFQEMDLINDYQPDDKDPELFISLILQADIGHQYVGKDFMPIFLSQGLRHGDMQIFHRYDSNNDDKTLYKVANAVKPGTFAMHDIEKFSTPAFAFFITLPGPNDPIAAYQAMVKSMNFFSEELGGSTLDQDKMPYDEESYRENIQTIKNYMLETLKSKEASQEAES